jgi:predicted RNA-binding protein YlxR (DUF448 family)
MVKKSPLRKCIACGNMFEKDMLYRVVRTENGVVLDKTYKAQGRGAYVCKNKACIENAIKRKSFNRSLKQTVPAEVFESINLELENDR